MINTIRDNLPLAGVGVLTSVLAGLTIAPQQFLRYQIRDLYLSTLGNATDTQSMISGINNIAIQTNYVSLITPISATLLLLSAGVMNVLLVRHMVPRDHQLLPGEVGEGRPIDDLFGRTIGAGLMVGLAGACLTGVVLYRN